MGLISQRIDNLLGGVSQQSDLLRDASQMQEQINAVSSPVRGLTKRPPSRHVAKLASDPTGYDSAFFHDLAVDDTERYRIVVVGGAVKAFDLSTGAEVTVEALPGATGYLADSTDFRALSIGSSVVLVNRSKVVGHLRTTTLAQKHEAIVYVRQADFSTSFRVQLAGVEVAYTTPDGTNAQARAEINTARIAEKLYALLVEKHTGTFVFTLYGSSIHVVRADGGDFQISCSDGLADKALRALKGSVQTPDELPYRARNGMVLEVAGNQGTEKDNYWVRYEDSGTAEGGGVWRECAKPGSLTSLDETTLPHLLSLRGRYMEEQKVSDLPPLVVKEGTVEYEFKAMTSTPDGTPVDEDTDDVVTDQGDGRQRPIPILDPTAKVNFRFALDTSSMVPGSLATVKLSKVNGDSTRTLLASKSFQAGDLNVNEITANGSDVSEQTVEMTLHYGDEATPTAPARKATLTIPGLRIIPQDWLDGHIIDGKPWKIDLGSIQIRHLKSYKIHVGTDVSMPIGVGLTVTIDGYGSATYTTASEFFDGDTLASGLASKIGFDLLGAGIQASVPSPGVVEITRADEGDMPAVTLSVSLDPTVTAWIPEVTLTADQHNGRTLLNLTDGSTGTITGGTQNTLTVSSLTGGAANKFQAGDRVVVVGSGNYFTFGPAPWKKREVGDEESNPWPSFVGRKITEAFFMENRLGYLTGGSVSLSSAGDLFNHFRQTATQLLPDDFIDIEGAHQEVTEFHSALSWNEGTYLLTDRGEFKLRGDPVLTPTSVQLLKVSAWGSTRRARPIPAGSRLFLPKERAGYTQVLDYVDPRDLEARAADTTLHVPTYLRGNPVCLAGDEGAGFLAVVTDADRSHLYIYSYALRDDGVRWLSSWGRWEFSAGTEILYAGVSKGLLGLVCKRSDGVYLEEINLLSAYDQAAQPLYLDRQVTLSGGTFDGTYTTYTLPYSASGVRAVNAGVLQEPVGYTQPTPTTLRFLTDTRAVTVVVGLPYEFRVEPGRLYIRDGQSGRPEPRGRLTVRYLDLYGEEDAAITVGVSRVGRNGSDFVRTFPSNRTESVRVPVMCQVDHASVVLKDSGWGPCSVYGLDWEGTYTSRSRRI